VKLPVAVELLRQAQQGTLSLDGAVRLEAADLIDGSPRLRRRKPGGELRVGELLELMLLYSDNTATDLLIRQVGLESINAGVRRLVPEGFSDITTLADVRRHAYSGLYPEAFRLTNSEILELSDVDGDERRVMELARLLNLTTEQAALPSLADSYSAYYSTGLNSATLISYGALLERIARGDALPPDATRRLMDTMTRVETGKRRIRAGLPASIVWAHKTGTQRARVADFGLAWPRQAAERQVVVAAVAMDFPSPRAAERALRSVGSALDACGVFAATPQDARR
jgi:beta-lactamase class A